MAPADDGPVVVQLQPALQLTDDQFHALCQRNRDLRIERTAEGELSILSPTGWETGNRNAEIVYRLRRWAKTAPARAWTRPRANGGPRRPAGNRSANVGPWREFESG